MKKQELKTKLIETLELPRDLFEGLPIIELTGNRKLYISNHRGILQYKQDEICIMSQALRIDVKGLDMILESYTREELVIRGYILFIGMVKL